MEVAEVLLADARFFVDFYRVPWERRGGGVGGGQGLQDPFCCFARAPVRRGVEVERVIGPEKGAELAPCFESLGESISEGFL